MFIPNENSYAGNEKCSCLNFVSLKSKNFFSEYAQDILQKILRPRYTTSIYVCIFKYINFYAEKLFEAILIPFVRYI